MKTQARSISTNQVGVHENLVDVLIKHQGSCFKRPIAEHTKAAFDECLLWLSDWSGEIILDACCGVGESTINIAQQYPHAKVIGVDKSIARLDKHDSYAASVKNQINDTNYMLVQADLNDFWRLLLTYIAEKKPAWQVVKQYILYPNPYPKKSQLSKRWHGSALLPYIFAVSSNIELRSNWKVYLDEFLVAARHYGYVGSISSIVDTPITPFERKYLQANQPCFKLETCASGCVK